MLWNRPYEERVVRLDLEAASLGHGIALRGALEALVPALEVLETEAFHIEFPDTLVAYCLKPVVCTDAGGTVVAVTGRSERGDILCCDAELSPAASCLGTDEILLGKAEYLRH